MGLVEDDEVAVQVLAVVHGVVELIPQYLGGPDDDGRIRVLLGVAREDPHILVVEGEAELHPLGVGQGLEGRGVPGPPPRSEDGPDSLLRDPGLSRPRRRRHKAIRPLDLPQSQGEGLTARVKAVRKTPAKVEATAMNETLSAEMQLVK